MGEFEQLNLIGFPRKHG